MNVNILLIIAIIIFIIEVVALIVFSQGYLKPQNKGKNGATAGDLSKVSSKELEESHKREKAKWEQMQLRLSEFRKELNELKCENERLSQDNVNLHDKLTNLSKDFISVKLRFNELEKLNGKETTLDSLSVIDKSDVSSLTGMESNMMSSKSTTRGRQNMDEKKEPNLKIEIDSKQNEMPRTAVHKEIIMYSSFPRSVNGHNYFADLTLSRVEESCFEFKISSDKRHATFAPLDFMKIRTCDAARVAVSTDGAKPNEASQVIKMEFGSAHEEEKDWIIDKPVKITLA